MEGFVCPLCASTKGIGVFVRPDGRNIYRCQVCGLGSVFPRLTKVEVSALYKDDWSHFDAYRSQENSHREYFQKLFNRLSTDVSLSGKKLLDIGCATGILLSVGKARGMEVLGVDISKSAVRFVKREGLPAVNGTVETVAKRMKLDRFDIVTALEIIEHEYDPIDMVKTVRTILKNSGILVITTPNFDSPWVKLMGTHWVGFSHPEHLSFFTPETLTRVLKLAGFRKITVEPDIKRSYSLGYAILRLGDYIPVLSPVTRFLSPYVSKISLPLPVNPWGDMLVIAKP